MRKRNRDEKTLEIKGHSHGGTQSCRDMWKRACNMPSNTLPSDIDILCPLSHWIGMKRDKQHIENKAVWLLRPGHSRHCSVSLLSWSAGSWRSYCHIVDTQTVIWGDHKQGSEPSCQYPVPTTWPCGWTTLEVNPPAPVNSTDDCGGTSWL